MSYNIFDRPESAIGSRSFGRKKTLDDLEKDEKFLETSERFLASVGENSDDIFEYLRDSDFNLYSGMRRAMQSGNFTEQQKKDYAYLRNEFDNADLGSLKQFAGLIGDAGIDIATDPTVIVAALAAPFTGGTSLATRTGIAATGLKTAKNFIGPPVPPSLATGALKTEGKKSVKKAAAVAGAEVGAWLGLDNHFRQSTELNTNLRKMYSTPELAGSIALGALTGGLIGGGIQKANLFYSKMNRLYSDPDYLKTEAGSFYDKVYKTLEFGDKIKSKTIGAATSILDTKAKFSPIARTLGKLFREDFDKRLGTITRERVGLGHGELLDDLRGDYHALFDAATAPLRVNGVLKETDELNLIKVLRGDNPSKYSETVQQVALDLRVLLNRVFDDAIEAGLIKPDRKLEDYFPRSWNRRAIQENRDIFEELLVSEKIVKDRTKAAELTDEMLNKNNELFSSHSILLTQARAFKDLNENVFEDFLTNDLNTLMNYYMNAANTIQHKRSFLLEGFSRKSNVNQFIERWITPMDRELRKARGGRGLSRSERRDIVNLYKSVTGQVNYFDSPVMQGIYDATKLANAMAYLPLATVSSLTEAMIPLTKTGGSVTGPVKDALKGIQEGHKIFVQDIPLLLKQKYKMTDSQIQKEMNQVFLAMDEAFAETTNRLSGEGLQNEFLKKVGRGFFRFNMLIPWTKSVQLASFNIGKNLIEEHLQTLSKLSKEGVDVITETATKDLSRAEIRNIQKIKSELFGLGIDIQDGLRWIDDGAKRGFGPARENNVLTGEIAYDDNFYKSVIQGAGRFVNEVIMPVGRDRARIPTFMTNPKLDIFTQFLRYPTVFSNTVLKNYINSVIVNPKVNAPKLGAFALSATSLALATNYWRSNEENRDRIAKEGFARNDVVKAFQRVGLLGPMEYGLRYGDSLEYTKNPYVSAAGLGGPLASDLTGLFLGRYGLTETVARKTPLIGTKPLMNKYFGANIFDPITTSAREIDKEIAYKFGIKDRPQSRRYSPTYEMSYRREYSVGGLIPEGPEVPFTKEDPASRINPYTGEPYQEDERTGFNEGGINQEALRSGVRPGEYRLMLRTKEDMDNLNNFASSFKTATESRKLEDMDIAYENFTKIPFSLQMAAYGPSVTDFPLSAYEADYFKRKSKAIDSDVELTTVSGSPSSMIFNMPIARYENAEKEMYEGLSKVAAASTLPAGLGVAGMAVKGAMLPFIRRGIQSKMDTTVGGGGSDVPITEPNVDLAGYSSALEIKAKEAMKNKNFQTGDDLINYLLSPKRTGLSKQELEFVNLESLKGLRFTPEEIVDQIGKDKPQLYRIERSADNPYFGTDKKTFQLDLEEDIEAGKAVTLGQKEFFYKSSVDQLGKLVEKIKPTNFRKELEYGYMQEYIDATAIVDTQPNFTLIDRTGELVTETKDVFIGNEGLYNSFLDAHQKITLRPILRNRNDVQKYVTKMADDYYKKPEIQERLFTTVGDTGNKYTIVGSDEFGYSVTRETPSGEFEELAAEVPFDEAQIQVRTASLEAGDFGVPADVADEPIYPNPMLEELQDMSTELKVEELLRKPLMTKYDTLEDYQLPKGGSKNYREFTLHIQNPKTKSRFYRAEGADFIPDKHFGGGDELAHYRVTERTDTEGKRVLFVEEIQSDIHAQGRKYGYEENVAEDRSDAMYAGKLPDFPYKNDWADLVVRDIIRLAADENFDRVSFVNAKEQLSRNLKAVNLYNKASVVKLPKANDKTLKVKKVLDEHDRKLSESKNNDLSFKEAREADIKFEKDFLENLKDLDDEYTKAKIIDIIKPGEYDFRDVNIDVTDKSLKRFLDRVLSTMIKEVDEFGTASGQTDKLTQAKKYFDNIIDGKDKYLVVTEGKTFSGTRITMPQLSNPRKAIDEGIGEEGNEIPFDSFSGDVYDFEFVDKDELINRYGMNPNTKQKLKDALQSENGFASLNEDFYLEDMDVFVRGNFGKNTNMTNVLEDYSNLFNKYDIELLGGQGRKFIDIYKDQIPRSINKFTKKYDKSNKPKITNVLSQHEYEGRVTPNDIYKIYKLLQTDYQDLSRKEIQDFRKNLDNPDAFDIKYIPNPRENSAITIDITDEIKDAVSRRRVTSMKDGGLVKQMNNLGLK